jgi:hypothetical protein
MQFQTAQLRPPVGGPGIQTRAIRTQPAQVSAKSGKSAWIIKPDIEQIVLLRLYISWNEIKVAGSLHISGADHEPLFVILQSAPADHLEVDCEEMEVFLGDRGLHTANNSQGGFYSVTALYHL